jgi:hypothetical protein
VILLSIRFPAIILGQQSLAKFSEIIALIERKDTINYSLILGAFAELRYTVRQQKCDIIRVLTQSCFYLNKDGVMTAYFANVIMNKQLWSVKG